MCIRQETKGGGEKEEDYKPSEFFDLNHVLDHYSIPYNLLVCILLVQSHFKVLHNF